MPLVLADFPRSIGVCSLCAAQHARLLCTHPRCFQIFSRVFNNTIIKLSAKFLFTGAGGARGAARRVRLAVHLPPAHRGAQRAGRAAHLAPYVVQACTSRGEKAAR